MNEVSAGFRALADRRRRAALGFITRHRTLTLPDLAEYVTEQEHDGAIPDVSEEQVRDVYFSLYHTHIPALEDAALVQYDQEHDLVGETEHATTVLATVRDEVDALL